MFCGHLPGTGISGPFQGDGAFPGGLKTDRKKKPGFHAKRSEE